MSSTGSATTSPPARRALATALGVATLAYPVLVYAGLQALPAGLIGGTLLLVVAVRLVAHRAGGALIGAGWAAAIAFGVLLAIAPATAVLGWPVLISLALAAVFAWSLHRPPSAIERIARLTEPHLPPAGVAYTRKVTVVWLCFFIGNAAFSAWTVFHASLETWTVYNGFVSYLIVGSIFVIELIVRRRVRRGAA